MDRRPARSITGSKVTGFKGVGGREIKPVLYFPIILTRNSYLKDSNNNFVNLDKDKLYIQSLDLNRMYKFIVIISFYFKSYPEHQTF
jgi:hypothetical protein